MRVGNKVKAVASGNLPLRATMATGNHAASSRKKGMSCVVGTATNTKIQAVQTKYANVFATKLAPDLDGETVQSYHMDRLKLAVKCRRIDSANSRHSSFQV